jgi:hypothetical protein
MRKMRRKNEVDDYVPECPYEEVLMQMSLAKIRMLVYVYGRPIPFDHFGNSPRDSVERHVCWNERVDGMFESSEHRLLQSKVIVRVDRVDIRSAESASRKFGLSMPDIREEIVHMTVLRFPA